MLMRSMPAVPRPIRRGDLQAYAKTMGVTPKRVYLAGGVAKLCSLSPEVQRILLGISR